MVSQEKKKSGTQSLLNDPRSVAKIMLDIKMAELEDKLKERDRLCRVSYCASFYLIIMVVLLFTIVCTSSIYFYDEYANSQTQHFRGRCNIPVASAQEIKQRMISPKMINNEIEPFYETFDLGLADDAYANIDVPSFQDGKPGRFIHDFSTNMTAIVDPDGMRCFIMPLDRNAVLPPDSLMDMIQKMMNGYYNINMNVIKHDMRVITPPIKDLSRIGVHINKECNGYEIYALEKYSHSVSKRSINEAVPVKYREFAGNTFQEFDILNLDEIIKYEEETKNIVPN